MKKISWHTETRKVKDLKPHKSNPRQITKEQMAQLKRSIEKFDYVELVAIQPDNTIIAGHMRIKALSVLGRKNEAIEVRVPNRQLTEGEAREYLIRSNKTTGEWDWDKLANEWNLKELCEWGFTAEELNFDVSEISPTEPDDETLSPPTNPKTKLGDIYDLGTHRLVCGDSTLPDTVKNCLGDSVPIIMVTDPPYGVNYDPEWREKSLKGGVKRTKGKVKNDDQFNWALTWHLFPGSVAYVWHACLFTSPVNQTLIEADYEIISHIIWKKQHFVLSRGNYHWQHEACWYAVKKGQNHNWQGARDQSTIWEIANLNPYGKNQEEERTCHSTQKPLECMARPIRNNSSKGEGVYDPFLGSGTTLLVAEMLERICYGIELDPAYCDIIVERWIKYRLKLGKEAKVIKNGKECKDFKCLKDA